MRFRRLVCGGLVPFALLAGCRSSGSPENEAGSGMPGDAAAPSARTVDVQIGASGYKPAAIGVARGETVTFNVVNNDSTVHELVLGDAKTQDAYEKTMAAMGKAPMNGMPDTPNIIEVPAGRSKAITWTFPNAKATVIYGSHQPGDYDKGLKGTITVR